MERRDFLKAGAAAGVAAATTGCATASGPKVAAPGAPALPIDTHEVAALTGRIDGVLGAMDHVRLVYELVPADLPVARDDDAQLAAVEQLLQNGVRSLYVSGAFLDQSAAMQAQPELQKRVADTLPAMDATVRQSTAVLAGLTEADQSRFQQTLRQHPDLGMSIAEVLDRRAAELGISGKRRMQLRLAATQVTTRMRDQHPGVLADEYLRKTNKAYVRHGEPELARKLAARAGEQMFWAPIVAAAPSPPAPYAPPPSPPYAHPTGGPGAAQPPRLDPYGYYGPGVTPPSPMTPPAPAYQGPDRPGQGALRAAAWMFGIGIGAFVGGALIVEAGAFPGVFLMTAGVVLFLVALITAIVGLIIRAAKG